MKKIILLLFTMPLFIYFLTCDRADMQTIAKYGPEPDVIYLFSDGATYDGNFNGNDPHTICNKMYTDFFSSLDVIRIEPLLSTTERDVRDIVPDMYSHVEVIGVDMTLTQSIILNSWSGLWRGTNTWLTGNLLDTLGTTDYWTGSTEFGTLAADNCDNWSGTASQGIMGDGAENANGWINAGPMPCSDSSTLTLICVGY